MVSLNSIISMIALGLLCDHIGPNMPMKGISITLLSARLRLSAPRKEAIQKTIMSMTLGKDVSALFPDVLKNIATADLDQKKLVYLYLMCVRLCPPAIIPPSCSHCLGITQNHIPTSVSWLSTHLSKTPRILTL